jgi:hypothetical protein
MVQSILYENPMEQFQPLAVSFSHIIPLQTLSITCCVLLKTRLSFKNSPCQTMEMHQQQSAISPSPKNNDDPDILILINLVCLQQQAPKELTK